MAKENANMAARYEHEIPEGYEARIEGNKVIIEKKEDVDEKIRKSIVDFIWRIANGAFNRGSMPSAVQCQEWLSYLEKQKEQKPVINGHKFHIGDTVTNGEDTYTINYIGNDYYGVKENYCITIPFEYEDMWKLIEQKPAKWNDADDKIQRNLMSLLSCMRGDRIAEDTYKKYYPWLRDLPKRFNLQKPAEWSEFDKGALKDAICAADRLGNDESFNKSNPNLAKAFRVAKDWLKSLPERFTLQPEQEVVDRTVFDRIADILRWCDLPIGCPIEDFKQSESEREHLLHIVQCVAHRYANSCTYCKEYSRGYQEGLSVPHWKPSEYTLSLVKKVANGEMLTHMEQMAMETLCNDLQKLL